jgi:AcrR family transcriptional regulator
MRRHDWLFQLTWHETHFVLQGQVMRLQVTREDYFEAALTILATKGHHALKMAPLCELLGVTTGSFYNYFGSWAEFTPELLAYWEGEQSRRLLEASNPQDSVGGPQTVDKLSSIVPHDAESAIRAWSNGDPVVAEFQHRVDSQRFAAVRAALGELITDDDRADILTVAAISMLIGMQQLGLSMDFSVFVGTDVGGAGTQPDEVLSEALAGVLLRAARSSERDGVAGVRATSGGRPRSWFTRQIGDRTG